MLSAQADIAFSRAEDFSPTAAGGEGIIPGNSLLTGVVNVAIITHKLHVFACIAGRERSRTMPPYQPQTTAAIKTLFSEEITHLGGTVVNAFDDGKRLFLRATLPRFREVAREDTVQCGVALRVVEEEIRIHPYVFRLICKNGAIMAHALQTREIENRGAQPTERFTAELSAAIQACGSEAAFSQSAEQMRSAQEREADMVLNLMPYLTERDSPIPQDKVLDMMAQFISSGRRSRYDLMNTFTAAARDIDDPALRWDMEEWGGGIAVGLTPKPVRNAGAAVSLEAARREWYLERQEDARERDAVPA